MQHTKTSRGIAALAAKGRNGDSTLVHMTPDEVAALQRIARTHGTSLTINPETGLPEASVLGKILPMLGGAAGMMFGIPPWITAAAIGGMTTAATGDLGKGLTAGLGAYGGANLAAGFGAQTMGTAASEAAAANAASTGAATAGAGAVGAAPATVAGMGGGTGLIAQPALDASIGAGSGLGGYGGAGLAEMGGGTGLTVQPTMTAGLDAGLAAPAQSQGLAALPNSAETLGISAPVDRMDLAARNWDKTTSGIEGLGTEQGRDAYLANMDGGKETAKMGLMALSPLLMGGDEQATGTQQGSRGKGHMRPYSLDRSAPMSEYVGQGERRYFNDTWTPGEVTPLANGGQVPGFFAGGGVGLFEQLAQQLKLKNTKGENPYSHYDYDTGEYVLKDGAAPLANGGQVPTYTPSTDDRYVSAANQQMRQKMSRGGITALAKGGTLGNYSDGGQALRGPGDGVSDSIPAVINGKRPAKLADGEFVVPARIVSELGNGSTEAGTRQLYAMLDRIQKRRSKTVGKGKVAVDAKARKLLPA